MPTKHTLTLAHSPDSDDMVMWWPLTGMIGPDGSPIGGPDGTPALDTGRFAFKTFPDDIERLNRRAIEQGDLDITAISAHAYPHIADRYRITACGASLGDGYGPKVVVPADSPIESLEDLARSGEKVAVPGVRTTGFLVLSLLTREWTGPRGLPHEAMLFSDVLAAVTSGRCGAGLLIHEAQLQVTSGDGQDSPRRGGSTPRVRPIADLGAAWKQRTGLPLPLGLNVVQRDLDARFGTGAEKEVAMLLESSIRLSRTHSDASRRFLRLHAGEGREEWNDDALLDRYMAMYVNDDTQDMGARGEQALARLFSEAAAAGLCPDAGPIDILRADS